jgi:hypothetical protein
MAERDYPQGHPAASDYKGEKYTPPRAPFAEDFGPDHPARLGKNIGVLDTPDGSHDRTVREWQANADRTEAAEPHAAPQVAAEDAASSQAQTTTITITGEVQTT